MSDNCTAEPIPAEVVQAFIDARTPPDPVPERLPPMWVGNIRAGVSYRREGATVVVTTFDQGAPTVVTKLGRDRLVAHIDRLTTLLSALPT